MEERNIMGELNMYRQLGLKPNFSEIGRRYGLDRHTVALYWNEGGDVDDGRCNRPSGFDAHSALIAEKAAMPGATRKAETFVAMPRPSARATWTMSARPRRSKRPSRSRRSRAASSGVAALARLIPTRVASARASWRRATSPTWVRQAAQRSTAITMNMIDIASLLPVKDSHDIVG